MKIINYRSSYWNQVANPWVSASVLAGGLISAILLYGLVQLNASVENGDAYSSVNQSSVSVLLN